MSAHPQGGHYDDGYGHQGQDAYYHDDQYGQYTDDQRGAYHDQPGHGGHGDAYYDESCVLCPMPMESRLIERQSLL